MRRLHKLRAKEISLTSAAANRRIFATYKSANKGEPMPQSEREQLRSQLESVDPAICEQLEMIVSKAADKGEGLSPKAASVIKAIGRLLAPHAGEISQDHIMAACKAAGLGDVLASADDDMGKAAKNPTKADMVEEEDEEEDEADDEDEEDEEADEAEDEAEEGDDEEDEDDEAETGKSVKIAPIQEMAQHRAIETPTAQPEAAIPTQPKGGSVAKTEQAPVAKAASLEEMHKQNTELAKTVEALRKHIDSQEQIAKAEKAERELNDLKKSVSENYAQLGVDAETLAPALKALKDMPEKGHFDAVMDVLEKSVSYRRTMEGPSGLFKSYGRSGSGQSGLGAEERLNQLVKSEMKKTEHLGKTEQQVYRDVCKSNPEAALLKQQASRENLAVGV